MGQSDDEACIDRPPKLLTAAEKLKRGDQVAEDDTQSYKLLQKGTGKFNVISVTDSTVHVESMGLP